MTDDTTAQLQDAARQRAAVLPPPMLSTTQASPWRLVGLVAAGVIVLSAFLPWITLRAVLIGEVSARGTEGDGLFAIGLGIAVAVSFALRKQLLATVMAGLSAVFAVFELVTVGHKIVGVNADFEYGTVSIGIGLWVLALGAAVALVAAFVNRAD